MLIHGKPVLVSDVNQVAQRISAVALPLVRQVGMRSFVGVPLRSQQRILGYLGADRGEQVCSQEDLDLLMTIGSHVAVAIDNASAYTVEGLTQNLEQRVLGTQELQSANERLQEHDRRRSNSCRSLRLELRTPMTSIKGSSRTCWTG
ncbi:MAG: GAF domain-containing protein [Nitrospiraceae bacterium]